MAHGLSRGSFLTHRYLYFRVAVTTPPVRLEKTEITGTFEKARLRGLGKIAPPNDKCNTAIPIPITSLESPILGTTVGSSIEDFDSLLLHSSCSEDELESLYESGPGVWYSYESNSGTKFDIICVSKF